MKVERKCPSVGSAELADRVGRCAFGYVPAAGQQLLAAAKPRVASTVFRSRLPFHQEASWTDADTHEALQPALQKSCA